MADKICKGCKKCLDYFNFYKHSGMKDGYLNYCKDCCWNKQKIKLENDIILIEKRKISINKHYQNNKNKIYSKNKKWKLDNPNYHKEYYQDNKESLDKLFKKKYQDNKLNYSNRSKEYYQNNKFKIKIKVKEYQEFIINDPIKYEIKKKKQNKYHKEYRLKNPHIYILRNQIRNIKDKLLVDKNNEILKELNYSPLDFKTHIENLWENNMNWGNIGNTKNRWNIDHKIPITWFKINTPFKIVNDLRNIHPIWSSENLEKGNRYNHIITKEYFLVCKDYILEEKLKLVKYELDL